MNHLAIFFFIFFTSFYTKVSAQFSTLSQDTLSKKRLHLVAGVGGGAYVGGISFLSFVWYKDSKRVPFHWYDDTKGYLQMDKAGHAYAAYHESLAAYQALRWAGVSKKKALLWGGPVGLIFQTPIEVFDGLYENWGFSWPDMIANTFGSALFMSQQAFLDDQVVRMKFSYAPSIYPSYHHSLGETPVESFFLDYNAHTYWLSANLQRITGAQKLPPWLNLAVGYSSNGVIKEFSNPTFYRGEPFPYLPRYRQYLLSLDVDFTKIKTNKKWVRMLLKAANMIKVPFPALEVNRIEGFRFRPIYF